ncbi:MAG: nitrous oxide reductase accessory protein NosL [Thermodesulfobacteriota bacterium]
MKRKLIFLLFSFLIISCKNEAEIKPSEIFYGQDICERCKMIISEKDYSAQYILPRGKEKKFDDIGCMIHYMFEENNRGDEILAIYVRDYNSKDWIDGQKAFYVWSEKIITPMGHGIVALEDSESAESLANSKGGKMLEDFIEVKTWVLNRDRKIAN